MKKLLFLLLIPLLSFGQDFDFTCGQGYSFELKEAPYESENCNAVLDYSLEVDEGYTAEWRSRAVGSDVWTSFLTLNPSSFGRAFINRPERAEWEMAVFVNDELVSDLGTLEFGGPCTPFEQYGADNPTLDTPDGMFYLHQSTPDTLFYNMSEDGGPSNHIEVTITEGGNIIVDTNCGNYTDTGKALNPETNVLEPCEDFQADVPCIGFDTPGEAVAHAIEQCFNN